MKFTIEDLYDMLTEENPQLQVELLEDGNLSVVGPSTFVDNPELMEQLQLHVMKVTSMAASMGMFFPNEMTTMLKHYTENGDKEDGE